MSNTIKIKRGSTTPTTSNISSYELGFDTNSKILYINNNGTIVPIANSFIGSFTTAAGTRNSLGLGNTSGAVPIANGGTGSTSASAARTALGITPANIGAALSSHTHTKSQITDFSHTHTSAEISNWDSLLEKLFPVGAIYISATEQSPAPLFSYETEWDKITDRFLVGAGSSYTSGATGGEAKHTLTESEAPYKNWGFWARSIYYSSDTHYALSNIANVSLAHAYTSSWNSTSSAGSYHYHTTANWNYGGGGHTTTYLHTKQSSFTNALRKFHKTSKAPTRKFKASGYCLCKGGVC